jgi:hypothetical protein
MFLIHCFSVILKRLTAINFASRAISKHQRNRLILFYETKYKKLFTKPCLVCVCVCVCVCVRVRAGARACLYIQFLTRFTTLQTPAVIKYFHDAGLPNDNEFKIQFSKRTTVLRSLLKGIRSINL